MAGPCGHCGCEWRDHPLADTGLAKEKNGRIHGRHLLDPQEYM